MAIRRWFGVPFRVVSLRWIAVGAPDDKLGHEDIPALARGTAPVSPRTQPARPRHPSCSDQRLRQAWGQSPAAAAGPESGHSNAKTNMARAAGAARLYPALSTAAVP